MLSGSQRQKVAIARACVRNSEFVMMDEPKGTSATFGFSTASWNAAKIAGNIIKRIGPLLNLTPIE